MSLTARDLMTADVFSVHPEMPLHELERAFVSRKAHGFPVIDRGRLIGIVAVSDVVRQLVVEQSIAEMVSDYYRADTGFENDAEASLQGIGDQVGERWERLKVEDVMIRKLITVCPEQPIRAVAQTMVDHRVRRVIVTDEDRMVGTVTSEDLIRQIAEGALVPRDSVDD